MMRSCISARGIRAETSSQLFQPGLASKPKIWPRRPEMTRCALEVASEGREMVTLQMGSSSTGLHWGRPSLMASRPACLKAISELSTAWCWPSVSVTERSTTGKPSGPEVR